METRLNINPAHNVPAPLVLTANVEETSGPSTPTAPATPRRSESQDPPTIDHSQPKTETPKEDREQPRPVGQEQATGEAQKVDKEQPRPVGQQRPATWRAARITLDEFRRRYFLEGNRPRRADVIRWIEVGTAEGRQLPAYLLDGRYYIQVVAADAFLTASKVKTDKAAPRPRAASNWHDKKTALELRGMGFSFM